MFRVLVACPRPSLGSRFGSGSGSGFGGHQTLQVVQGVDQKSGQPGCLGFGQLALFLTLALPFRCQKTMEAHPEAAQGPGERFPQSRSVYQDPVAFLVQFCLCFSGSYEDCFLKTRTFLLLQYHAEPHVRVLEEEL